MGSRKVLFDSVRLSVAVAGLSLSASAFSQAIPQKNVNVIGPTPINWYYAGNPRMQQNEPECAVSPTNPNWLFCGFNDYRGVNDEAIGDSVMGVGMSRTRGRTWISGLAPGHLKDPVYSIGEKFGADANIEALPGYLLFNYIAGWRDGTTPGGVYVGRYYEHNREVGPPWEILDIVQIDVGTSGKFLDKPAFDVALKPPGTPPVTIPIPAYSDPRNIDNNVPAFDLEVPAHRAHLCYSVFVGNDNNDGTKLTCVASDDGGITWPMRQKISESSHVNQGASIATRNFGQDVLVVWRRFDTTNQTNAIMYVYSGNGGNSFTKPKVLTELCAFDQGTGAARFRTNALPVAVNNGNEFAVYFSSRNDATETCFIEGKGKKKGTMTPRMSDVADIDDFDSFGESRDANGVRIRDGKVRTFLNYSRIMMVRSSGSGNNMGWSTPVEIDPQRYAAGATNADGSPIPAGARKRGHQFMPAAESAGGIETVAWYDSRLDRLNNLANPVPGGFVEDLVVNFSSANGMAPWDSVALLPAGLYDIVPPPLDNLPPAEGNIPLRRNIDVFAAQISSGGTPRPYFLDEDFYPAAGGAMSPSTRVSRFATRPTAGGGSEQVEYNFPNGRLFRKGRAPFIGDYNTVYAPQYKKLADGTWVPNQSAPNPATDIFASREPVFHVGWTSNRNVRGKVFYTGCDVWNESLQIWESVNENCPSTYTDPIPQTPRMMPLTGEDPGVDGPPMTCTMAQVNGQTPGPLTRNQNIYTAALLPGINGRVVSAIKPPVGDVNTFVVAFDNGTPEDKLLVLNLEADPSVTFVRAIDGPPVFDREIIVEIPKGSSNSRTVFDYANELDTPPPADRVILTATECNAVDANNDCLSTGDVVARLALERSSLAPLELVQNNPRCVPGATDPVTGECTEFEIPVDVNQEEIYDLILNRELVKQNLDLENLDLENLDLENTVFMLDLENLDLENLDLENLDLENLDLENVVLFLDLENLDLENLDLENLDLENSLYEALDLENLDLENLDLENRNLLFLDLENLDLENTFLQFLDLENLDLENLDLENLDLENISQLLDLENLDLENLDLENLDLENQSIVQKDLENLDLENLDLENTAPTDSYTEVTWTADSSTNTTTGVDVKPIFSDALGEALRASAESNGDFKVLLTVRQPYYNGTVVLNQDSLQYCAPQVVVENQLLYAKILDADQINSLTNDPNANVFNTPSFVADPDQSTIITLRFINPPAEFSPTRLDRNTGLAVYSQPGSQDTCDPEIQNDTLDLPDCEIDFQVPDEEPPVFDFIPPDVTIEATGATTPFTLESATATDNVDEDVSITSDAPSEFPLGSTTVTWTATDDEGNSAEATTVVTVNDSTAPVLSVPGNITAEATGAGTSVDIGSASATDAVGPVSISNDAPALFPVGSTTVTWTATDGQTPANVSTDTQVITIVDTTPPALTVPDDVSVEADGAFTAVSIGAATATDAVGPVTVTNDAPATFPVGTTVVTWTATDGQTPANASTATQNVTVSDTTAPALTVPADVSVEATGEFTAVAIGDATATDAVGPVSITNDAPATNPVGTTVVTWTATDGPTPANVSTATQNVTVSDTTAPALTVPADVSVEATGEFTAVAIGDATATDAVGPVSITNDAPATFPVGTTVVTWTATDGQTPANVSTATQNVTVSDTTAPALTVPADVSVEAEGEFTTVAIGNATATDAVGPVSVSNDAPVTFPVGTTVVTWTAIDGQNPANTSTDTQSVNVTDTTAPVISLTGDVSVTVEAGDDYTDAGATASDIVDGDLTASIVTSSDVDANTVGVYTVAYNVSDAAGLSALEVVRTVNVVDTTAPVISLNGDASVIVEAGSIYSDQGVSISDAGDPNVAARVVVVNPVNTAVVGSYTVTYNVTDAQGNQALEVTRAVDVVDTASPVITNPNPPVFVPQGPYVLPAGATSLTISWPISAQDLQNGLTITCSIDGIPLLPSSSVYDDATGILTASFSNDFTAGTSTGTCSVTDAGGNTTTSPPFNVTVEDIPVITLAGDPGTPIEVLAGEPFVDPGFSASDLVDGDLTNQVVVSPVIDESTPPGTYTVTYSVIDSAGNAAATVSRTVVVLDNAPPVLTAIKDPLRIGKDDDDSRIRVYESQLVANVTAIDAVDGDVSNTLSCLGQHYKRFRRGNYHITCSASDSQGNIGTVTFTLTIYDDDDDD